MKRKSAPLAIDENGNGCHTAHPVTLAFDYDRSEVKVKFRRDHQAVGTVTLREKSFDVKWSTDLTLDEQQTHVRAAKAFCAKRLNKDIRRLENWPHPVSEEDRENIDHFIASARHRLQAVN